MGGRSRSVQWWRWIPLLAALGAAGCAEASTSAAPQQHGAPTLGTASYAKRQHLGRGFGAVAPEQVNANGDPGSIIYDVHWTGWGHSQAIGRGKSYAPGANGGWTSTFKASHIRATDLGRCKPHGQIVYRRLWVLDTRDEPRRADAPEWPWVEWPSGQPMC